MSRLKLSVGCKVRYDGDIWEVVGLEGSAVRLRALTGGLTLVATRELVGAGDFEVLEGVPEGERTKIHAEEIEGMSKAAKKQALERLAHLREAETGYRSGNPDELTYGEPKPEYDPYLVSPTERVKTKARELGVAESTIYRWRGDYEEGGLAALPDGRMTRPRTTFDRLNVRARDELLAVVDGLTRKSTVSIQKILDDMKRRLDEKYGKGVVPLPSRATQYRAVSELTNGKVTKESAKTRRQNANKPETPYQRFDATRPGEAVLIDATELDVFALDISSTPPKWTSLELVLVLDVFTRSILAWRFLPRGMKAVDAALLLRDTITPKTMRPGWPDSTRWPYHGVPESLILGAFEGLGEIPGVAGVPVVRPEKAIVDRAKVFGSEVFREACNLLGISIQPARPYRPTDKAHIETMFRSIRLGLLERMPGYKGPDLYSRGEKVEGSAYYFVHEVESIFAQWVITYWQNKLHDGLRVPGAHKALMTPNDAYELGLQTAGFVHVPPSPELYYEMLPIEWRKIDSKGVNIDRLKYDGDALNPYRDLRSPHKGRHAGKWPIRLDPRDLSRAYFKDPEDDVWRELPWRNHPSPHRPFNDKLLNYGKAILFARQGMPGGSDREIADILDEIFEREDQQRLLDNKERSLIARSAMHAEGADRDRQTSPHLRPAKVAQDNHQTKTTRTNSKRIQEDDGWDLDPSKIEPYPARGEPGFDGPWLEGE